MNDLLPRKNQRIEVQTSLHADRRFPTWVEDVRPPMLTVAAPMDQEHYVPLPPGEEVRLHYSDGRGDLVLTAIVRERPRRGESLLLEVLEVSRVQRRQFFRWEGRYPVWFRIVTKGEAADEEEDPLGPDVEEEWLSAYTHDLSGGGLSLQWDEAIPPRTAVIVELRLPTGVVRAEGRVARSWPDREGGTGHYFVGIEFSRISDSNRRKLLRFITNEELRFRRR